MVMGFGSPVASIFATRANLESDHDRPADLWTNAPCPPIGLRPPSEQGAHPTAASYTTPRDVNSLEAARRPVILTERRDHLDYLRARFEKFTRNLVVLYGGMNAAERRAAEDGLKRPATEERLVLATGRYLGEGFDDASLDTLFLTMPISWRGTLAQYVGRLHREHHAKREVLVYDYVDSEVPMLARMALKRQTGYRSLGYEVAQA
jgi:superfamily II DNA or RNA helicase